MIPNKRDTFKYKGEIYLFDGKSIYNSAMQEVPEARADYLWFKRNGRTPLSVASNFVESWAKKALGTPQRFPNFLNEFERPEEREKLIRKFIPKIEVFIESRPDNWVDDDIYDEFEKLLQKLKISECEVISGFNFGEDEPSWTKETLSEIFDLMVKKGGMQKNDQPNFIKAFQGGKIEKPILWRYTVKSTDKGHEGSLKNFLVLLFKGYNKRAFVTAASLFIDTEGNRSLNPESKYSNKEIIYTADIYKELKNIIDNANNKPQPK